MCPIANNQVEDAPKILTETATPGSTGANKGTFFPKDVGTVTEAFYRDDQGRDIQLTNDGNPNGGAASAAVKAGTITIPTGGSLAVRLAAATGLPSGWTLVEGDDGGVHSSLGTFGAVAGDVVLIHNSAKPPASIRVVKTDGGVIKKAPFNEDTEQVESTDFNQVLFKTFENVANAGTGTSIMTVLIPT